MGKVYDALQRAEQERAKRAAEAVSAPAARGPELREPEEASPALPPPRLPEPSRRTVAPSGGLLSRLRARLGETASDPNKRRIALLQPESVVAEQFRSLRARIDSLRVQQPLSTLGLTSALDGDGKTTAAVNLALVMSMDEERRVLLIDCDMRDPKVASSLGIRVEAGLAEVLRGEVPHDRALYRVENARLAVLPVRSVPPNPAELLASSRMRDLLQKLSSEYDQVLVDLPPTLGLPDAQTVGDLCDGIVFVVRADVTPAEDVNASLDILDRRRVVGLVLNGTEGSPTHYGS